MLSFALRYFLLIPGIDEVAAMQVAGESEPLSWRESLFVAGFFGGLGVFSTLMYNFRHDSFHHDRSTSGGIWTYAIVGCIGAAIGLFLIQNSRGQ